MAKNAADVAAKWSSRLGAAGAQIEAGVRGVTVSPGQAAARQADVWAANTAAAKAKFQTRSAAVSTSDWQEATISKGIPRVQAGAQAAVPKVESFMGQLLPFVDQARQSLPPRGNLETNIQRSQAFIRKMATFQRR